MNDENLQKVVEEYIKSSSEDVSNSSWKNIFTGNFPTFPSSFTKTPVDRLFDLNAFGKRVVFISPEDKTTESLLGAIGVSVHELIPNVKFFFLSEYEEKSKDKI